MTGPILAAKLEMPQRRPELVKRPRLLERLTSGLISDFGFSRRLTIVAGPAGFGKTTLLRQWIRELDSQISFLWYSLDHEDSDPHRFFTHVAAASENIPGIGRSIQGMLGSPQMVPARSLATAFIREKDVPLKT